MNICDESILQATVEAEKNEEVKVWPWSLLNQKGVD